LAFFWAKKTLGIADAEIHQKILRRISMCHYPWTRRLGALGLELTGVEDTTFKGENGILSSGSG
jgi:hypothetical protein